MKYQMHEKNIFLDKPTLQLVIIVVVVVVVVVVDLHSASRSASNVSPYCKKFGSRSRSEVVGTPSTVPERV